MIMPLHNDDRLQ